MRAASLALASLLAFGCGSRPVPTAPVAKVEPYPAPTALPPLPKFAVPQKGIAYAEVDLPRPGAIPERLWIYLPEGAKGKLPVVFIAPAGAPMWHGMALGDGDRPEHLPYVRAGYAVVAYAVDGDLSVESPTDAQARTAIEAFRRADDGVRNAEDAIAYALARLPVDPRRMFAVGHSSSGTLALQVASREPRLAGCVTYMPVTDLAKRWGSDAAFLNELSPGYTDWARALSPVEATMSLKCPLFLYGAEDDAKIPVADLQAFATKVRATNPSVTLGVAASGGHYDAMMERGVPAALAWLGAHGGVPKGDGLERDQ